LYKAADAFVLPSRGEGWGRPHVEAMSMGEEEEEEEEEARHHGSTDR